KSTRHNRRTRSEGAADRSRVNPSEARAGQALRVARLRREGVCVGGNIQSGPIEDVRELRPNLKVGSFFDAEVTPQAHALHGTALLPEIVVVGVGGAELAVGRICA